MCVYILATGKCILRTRVSTIFYRHTRSVSERSHDAGVEIHGSDRKEKRFSIKTPPRKHCFISRILFEIKAARIALRRVRENENSLASNRTTKTTEPTLTNNGRLTRSDGICRTDKLTGTSGAVSCVLHIRVVLHYTHAYIYKIYIQRYVYTYIYI